MAHAARSDTRLDIAMLALCVVAAIMTLALPPQMREPVAGALRRTVMAPLVIVQRGAEQWRVAWLESERLAVGRDSLALKAADVNSLQLENAHLRGLLGLGGRLRWGFVPAEALQETARPGGVITSLVVSAGSKAGIATYSPVVGPAGIIGLVQTADPSASIVLLYSHADFRVSAVNTDGTVFGIVYPHAGSGSEGYLLELRNVAFRTLLKPGTTIITSGLGGTFPRGIPIGTVIAEINTTEGWSRTYLIRPAVNPSDLTSVMVLTPQRSAQGVAGVWSLPANADSTARAVAAAADSVARRATQLEAARQRAHADSLKADSVRADSVRRAGGGAGGER